MCTNNWRTIQRLRKRIRLMYVAFAEYSQALVLADDNHSVVKELAWLADAQKLWKKTLMMLQLNYTLADNRTSVLGPRA